MKPTVSFLTLLVAGLALILAGCGKSETSAARADGSPAAGGTAAPAAPPAAPKPGDASAIVTAYVDDMDKMGGLFKQVTDEASAQKHGPEIKTISARLHGLAEQMKTMDPMTKGMAFAARAQEITKIQQEMAPELQRISKDQTLAKHLGDAMRPPKIN